MRMHPKKILWPTDLSPLSLKGGEYARLFAQTFGAELHVIHVAPILISNSSTAMMTAGDSVVGVADTVKPAKRELENLLNKEFGGAAKGMRRAVVVGNAWYEICRYATKNAIDLTILATHGVTGLKHLLMGSTAERVVQHAPCPVLAVKSFERGFIEDEAAATIKLRTPRKQNRQRQGAARRTSRST